MNFLVTGEVSGVIEGLAAQFAGINLLRSRSGWGGLLQVSRGGRGGRERGGRGVRVTRTVLR